jgi:hypothetical protein
MSGFRLHLYNSAPTAILDNSAFNIPVADRSKYIGYIDFDTPSDLGDTLFTQALNVNLFATLATGSTTLYGILQTIGGYTPTSATVKTVNLTVVGV